MPSLVTEEEFKAIKIGVDHSDRLLQRPREIRREIVKLMVGKNYSEHGAKKHQPVNFLAQYASTMSRYLAARNPAAQIETKVQALKPFAETTRLMTNDLIEEIDFVTVIRTAVVNALFGQAIVKVGLNPSRTIELEGFHHDIGEPYAHLIDDDDYTYDMTALRWEQIGFVGDRYRLTDDQFTGSGVFENTKDVSVSHENTGLQPDGTQKSESISRGDTDPHGYVKYIELQDLWLPRKNAIITYPVKQQNVMVRQVRWDGPEKGPYHRLYFGEVPSNILPLSPMSLLMELHDIANRTFRKLTRQADASKTVMGYRGGDQAQVEMALKADDLGSVQLDDAKSINALHLGGIDQPTFAFFIHTQELFDKMSGNLSLLAGLGPQSDTAAQDKLLNANANIQVSDMEDRTSDFAGGIFSDLAWYEWNNPIVSRQFQKAVPGIPGLTVTSTFDTDSRMGEFWEYNFKLVPYSMKHLTPQEQLTFITAFLREIQPWLPMLQAQGKIINIARFTELAADFGNVPALREIITDFDGTWGDDMLTPQGTKAPNTHRTTERISRTGTTQSTRNASLIQSLLGGGSGQQQSQESRQFQGAG